MSKDRPDLTDEQQAAVDTRDVSIALSAGAGCGKTTVLTQRFLSHLKPGEPTELSQLVAITFTEKAAREMRDRIRSACRRQLRQCPDADVEHWLQILWSLDGARVSTIHAFCSSLLRANAVEAGLDPRFALADPPQTAALVDRSVRDTLHRLLEQQDDDAMALVVAYGLDGAREVLGDLVQQRFDFDPLTPTSMTQARLVEEWPRVWRLKCVPQMLDEFQKSSPCTDVADWLETHAADIPASARRQYHALLAHLKQPPPDGAQADEWLDAIVRLARIQGAGSKSDWADEAAKGELKDVLTKLRDRARDLQKKLAYSPEDVHAAAESTERGNRLAARAIHDYEELKRQHGLLDFDDLILRARNLLRDAPDVARKLERGVKLLMVDEFQDTDPVQADIIRFLAGPALESGKLFLVGDVQQSIYRFRRADPGVFETLQAQLPERGRLKLTRNFRSVPDILNFVNCVFAKALGDSYQRLAHSEAHQVSKEQRKKIGAVVEFLWAAHDVEPSDVPPTAKPKAGDLRCREADWIARRIGALLADERPTVRFKDAAGTLQLRRVRKGDIVILFRTLSDAPLYEAALTKYGIDYYLVGGKTFYAQQEVFDLLNLSRWLDEPADEISLIGCLRSPFFNLSDDAIHALKAQAATVKEALSNPPPDWLPEDERERIRFAAKVLHALRQSKDRLPPSELLRGAVQQTGYDAALLHEHLGPRKVANLEKLLLQAADFDNGELFTLGDYVRELERSVRDETEESLAATLPEAGDVVRLMTIHQSKGLEFPVVFVADMNRKLNSQSRGAVMHREWGALLPPPQDFGDETEHLGLKIHRCLETSAQEQEFLRLLYVAMTRAADRLILSAGMTPDLKVESLWLRLISERFQLETGLLKSDPYFASSSGAGAGRDLVPDVQVHTSPPSPPDQKTSKERLVPLAQLAERIADAEPTPFPESARVFPPASDAHGILSVSRLEELLRSPTSKTPDAETHDGDERHVAPDVLGTVVHRVFERIDFQRPDAWPELLDAALPTDASPQMRTALSRQASELINGLVGSSLVGKLAQADVLLREIDFLLSWPPTEKRPIAIVSGQIDVLAKQSDGWHLFDYKTGQFPLSTPDQELLAPYTVQLAVYALAAERRLGQPLASINLVAFRPKLRLLRFDWTPAVRDAVVSNIDAVLRSGAPLVCG